MTSKTEKLACRIQDLRSDMGTLQAELDSMLDEFINLTEGGEKTSPSKPASPRKPKAGTPKKAQATAKIDVGTILHYVKSNSSESIFRVVKIAKNGNADLRNQATGFTGSWKASTIAAMLQTGNLRIDG